MYMWGSYDGCCCPCALFIDYKCINISLIGRSFLGTEMRFLKYHIISKQDTLTPPGHLVSPLACRGPWMSTVVLYCWCHSDSASVLLYFTFINDLGAACQQNALTPPSNWSCPTLGFAFVLMPRPISPELILFPDFWDSNSPRHFSFPLWFVIAKFSSKKFQHEYNFVFYIQHFTSLNHKLFWIFHIITSILNLYWFVVETKRVMLCAGCKL